MGLHYDVNLVVILDNNVVFTNWGVDEKFLIYLHLGEGWTINSFLTNWGVDELMVAYFQNSVILA